MNNLALHRQDHKASDFKELERMINTLKKFLTEDVNPTDEEWLNSFNEIIRFQDNDGSFKLVDSFNIESDACVDFCYMPTYICSAIIMKAFMNDKAVLTGREPAFANALKACCGNRLSGHGYEALAGKLKALLVFKEAGLREFIKYHSDISPEFSDMIRDLAAELKAREANSDTNGLWGEDYSEDIHSLNEYFSHSIVFVYGTLLEGEHNHDYYLNDNTCIGKAEIAGFDMFDTGSYPAIVPGMGTVKGELYEITEEDLKRLDCLEGEGSLYIRQCIPAMTESGETVLAHVYVYNKSTDGLERIPYEMQPYTAKWKEKANNYVWYVSYGSNMLKERFLCYIKGRRFSGGGRDNPPCKDTSDPIAVSAYEIPYDMYFGNSSGVWGGKGVSFLDITRPGHALGVAYLITREQLEHVSRQENAGNKPEHSPNWYNSVQSLGIFKGCEVFTITNDSVREYNAPSDAYRDTLAKGIYENYPDIGGEEIREYLDRCERQ